MQWIGTTAGAVGKAYAGAEGRASTAGAEGRASIAGAVGRPNVGAVG